MLKVMSPAPFSYRYGRNGDRSIIGNKHAGKIESAQYVQRASGAMPDA
jgi:hypothetical protein